jgi:hypothetical protein
VELGLDAGNIFFLSRHVKWFVVREGARQTFSEPRGSPPRKLSSNFKLASNTSRLMVGLGGFCFIGLRSGHAEHFGMMRANQLGLLATRQELTWLDHGGVNVEAAL